MSTACAEKTWLEVQVYHNTFNRSVDVVKFYRTIIVGANIYGMQTQTTARSIAFTSVPRCVPCLRVYGRVTSRVLSGYQIRREGKTSKDGVILGEQQYFLYFVFLFQRLRDSNTPHRRSFRDRFLRQLDPVIICCPPSHTFPLSSTDGRPSVEISKMNYIKEDAVSGVVEDLIPVWYRRSSYPQLLRHVAEQLTLGGLLPCFHVTCFSRKKRKNVPLVRAALRMKVSR